VKITKGKVKGVVVQLGAADIKKWEDAGGSGVVFRHKVMAEARSFAMRKGIRSGYIDVYAPRSAGGWTAESERID